MHKLLRDYFIQKNSILMGMLKNIPGHILGLAAILANIIP